MDRSRRFKYRQETSLVELVHKHRQQFFGGTGPTQQELNTEQWDGSSWTEVQQFKLQ